MTTATLMTEQALTSTRQTGEWIESQHLITDTPSEVVVASASPAAELTSFLQYWADDVLGGPHARTILLNTPFSGEQFVGTLFMPITMLLFLPTCLLAGGASDRWGRKGLVYVSGAMMTIVCLISIFFQTQYGALIAAAFFGIGFGAYTSVDMALTTEVLPPTDEAGKFMGIWSTMGVLAQVFGITIGGAILQLLHALPNHLNYTGLFVVTIICFALGTVGSGRSRGQGR